MLQDLPDTLLPYLRLAHCQDQAVLRRAALQHFDEPLPAEAEQQVLQNLASCLQQRLSRWVLNGQYPVSWNTLLVLGSVRLALQVDL